MNRQHSVSMEPFNAYIDLGTGRISPAAGPLVRRRLSDMHEAYLEPPGGRDDLVYEVHNIDVPATADNILSSTTVLYPGTVHDEYFMTKGHFHEVRGRAEIYTGISGEGLLLMATEDGRYAVEEIRPGAVNYVPGGWAHRSVNTGTEPLAFFAAYVGDAGHDYATIEQRGFPVAIVKGAQGPELRKNPRYQA